DFAIRRQAGLGRGKSSMKLEFDTHDLLYTIVSKVGILGRERGLRVDSRNAGIHGLVRIRVEVNAGSLANFGSADLPFGHEATQIYFGEIEQRHDRGARLNHFAWL